MDPAHALDEAALPALLARFYERVRRDDDLGPLFNDVVHDWDVHLERISDFWSSVILASGRYKGNPVVIHLMHAHRITSEMFERWLMLWEETTSEMLPDAVAAAMQAKARRIADTLKVALRMRGAPLTNPVREPSPSVALPG
ncbi:group III truncated hemoglobin [Inquilinus limosus]|uniref:Preprotein translocase subunit TatC n=1 Tax=Inquilinus limosus TaxID=171674 RepID=A0A211ZUE6_9PROT|nr:group III truncated hemoglobin [Inquilinus limosus]OWJ68829.1 preprotein translocase subunit TatC [Inquilinus limosus]